MKIKYTPEREPDMYEDEDNGSEASYSLRLPEIYAVGPTLTPAPGNHFFFFEGKATWLNRSRQQPASSLDSRMMKFQDTITVRMATRDKRVLSRLLESIDSYRRNAQIPDGCMRVWCCEYNNWYCRGSRQARSLESVVLPEGQMEAITSDLEWFWSNSARYYSLGIPYRRGWLLRGVPGSGKTSLVGAIAGHYKRDIYILSLNEDSMSDTRLLNLISSVKKGSIVLIEDIDAAFNKREGGKDGVTFSGLLNALDGVASPDDLVLFMTTNHPEKLDPALIRPGRIDRTMDFCAATDDQLERIYKRFTNGQNPEGFVQFFRGKTVAEAQVYLLGKEIAA